MAKQSQQQSPIKNLERIIVIQTAFLGDIVLTTSFLQALRKCAPQAKILFVTTKIGAEVLTPNSWNIDILVYDKRNSESGLRGFQKKVRELRRWKPDMVFCLHRSFRSVLLAKFSGAHTVLGFREASGQFLFQEAISRKEYIFEAEKNLALLKRIFPVAANESLFPKLAVSEQDLFEAKKLLESLAGKKFAVYSPSSVWATKRWPAERFGEVAAKIEAEFGLAPIFIGGNTEDDLLCSAAAEAAWSSVSASKLGLNLTGKTHLGILKAILGQAEIVLCNDSAPLHIAIAMNTKVVAVFGPTTKALGFFPLAPEGKSVVAEVENLSCRPCGLHGHHKCPQKHFRCMLDLTPAQVIEKMRTIMGNL